MFLGSPTPELIEQTTEAVARFIQWIAELLRRRNWFMLLVLVGVALSLLGGFFRDWLNPFLPDTIEGRFWQGFGVLVAVVFVAALVVAVVTMPRAAADAPDDAPERQAIKGLRPFNREDAKIFAQLQRRQMLRDCTEALTSPSYRFGILMGESGCGKTSFLQAGLWPRLTHPESSHLGVYVRFSEQDPLTTLYQAIAEQLDLPLDWLNGPLVEVLTQIQTADAAQPLVLLLDQFEQVFVHNPRPEQRQPFIQALTAWYQTPALRTVRVLVSIRADLLHELHELLQALNCNLGPQERFKLERFAPEAASEILAVIAATEGMVFDRRFVTELAERELAHPERGTISPVDLQVLAWMIGQQQSEELRAFNQQAFQRFGGVEGLLSRFLEKALAARVLPGQRDAAVKVLLALTDLDRQVRAGVLTLPELQAKMRGTVKPEAISEAVAWLARGDVRLLTPQDKAQQRGYELAHERLIPALLRLAERELTVADKASQLLERRLNEWLGNERQSRYLLGLGELWLIRRQWPYLKWGDSLKRRRKEKFVRLSQRRFVWGFGVLASVVAVGLMFWGWLWFTPAGQMQQVQWALERQIAQPNQSQEQIADIALAFIKDGQEKRGFDAIERHISSQWIKTGVLSQVAKVAVQLADTDLLEETLDVAQEIEPDQLGAKIEALIAIADAIGKFPDEEMAQILLKKMMAVIANIDDFVRIAPLKAAAQAYESIGTEGILQTLIEKQLDEIVELYALVSDANVLSKVAASQQSLGDAGKSQTLLRESLRAVSQVEDASIQGSILKDLIDTTGEIKDHQIAQEIIKEIFGVMMQYQGYDSIEQADALLDIIDVVGESNNKEVQESFLKSGLSMISGSDSHAFSIYALPGIARAYMELGNERKAKEVLKDSLILFFEDDRGYLYSVDMHEAITDISIKLKNRNEAQYLIRDILRRALESRHLNKQVFIFSTIANAAGYLMDKGQAYYFLEEIVDFSKQTSFWPNVEALVSAANTYEKLRDEVISQDLLQQALSIAENIDDTLNQYSALESIAHAATNSGNADASKEIIQRLVGIAKQSKDSKILTKTGLYYASHDDLAKALQILRTCTESDRMAAYATILTYHAEAKRPQLINGPTVLNITPSKIESGAVQLEVTIQSPDEDCEHHADWWEVLSEDGEILGRHLLNKPYNFEQPFTTTDTFQKVKPDQTILIRAHFSSDLMIEGGGRFVHERSRPKQHYPTQALRGIPNQPQSFQSIRLPARFAIHVEDDEPQPQPCQEQ